MSKLKLSNEAITIQFDKIRNYIDNQDAPELSPIDAMMLKRLDFAYDQLKTETIAATAVRIQRKFELGRTQAYKTIREAQRLFNPIHRKDTDFIRNLIVEDAQLQMQVAREMLDHKAWQKARADLKDIWRTEMGLTETVDAKMLGNNKYFVLINVGNGRAKKIDLDKINDMQASEKEQAADFLFPEISENEAEFLIES